MPDLGELVRRSAEGDETSLIALIEKFQPLLKSYTHKLDYEDAYNDLLLSLIKLLKQYKVAEMRSFKEEFFLSYISKSVKHSFIALSKKQGKRRNLATVSLSDYDDEYSSVWDKLLNQNDEYRQVDYDFLFKILTKYEAEIIIYIFYFMYTVKEVAALYGVSMPAITQAKKNAMKKLKHYYENAKQ